MRHVLLYLLWAFLLVSVAFALDSTTDPTPTIRLEFSQEDTPLTIHTAKLIYPSGLQQNLTIFPLNAYIYDFSVNAYLLQGNYSIQINVSDNDGNEKFVEENFTLSTGPAQIWLQEPRVPFLPEKSQDFAIANSSNFSLSFTTIAPANCRLTRYRPPITDLASLYSASGAAMYFNNNPGSLSTSHQITVEQGSGFLQNKLVLPNPFDYSDISRNEYAVVCQQTALDGAVNYFARPFFIGYDTSSPQFNINFTPQRIQDPGNVSTSMRITSQNDLLLCNYTHVQNPNNYQGIAAGVLPKDFHLLSTLADYSSSFNRTLSFPNTFFLDPETNFSVAVTCQNPARLDATQTQIYTVALDSQVTISVAETTFATTRPTLNFTTNINTLCTVDFDGESEDLTTDFTTEHSFSPGTLPQGMHSLNIYCESATGTASQETIDFTIDTIPPPAPLLSSPLLTCGEDFARLEILNATEEVNYNITLQQGQTQIDSRIHPFAPQLENVLHAVSLSENLSGSATWVVRAIDAAGLVSQASTLSFTISDDSPLQCDTTPPEVTVTVNESFSNYDILLSCVDTGSDCATTYSYALVNSSTCPNSLSQSHPVDTVLSLSQDGRFCYAVQNGAGLQTTGYELLLDPVAIDIITPEFGLSNSNPFIFEASTNVAATCAHGPLSTGDDASRFANSTLFATTGQLTHRSTLNTNDYSVFTDPLQDQAPWQVICQRNGEFFSTEFELGYDFTPPIINVSFDPNPLASAVSMTTLLQVETSDPSVCTYLNESGIPVGFPNYNPDNALEYVTDHAAQLSYFALNTSTLVQTIHCRNIAQSTTEVQANLSIAPPNPLNILVTSPKYSSAATYELTWQTNDIATCRFRRDKNQAFQTALETGGFNHSTRFSGLVNGEYFVELTCGTGLQESYHATSFIIDTQAPLLEIYTQHPSCTNNELIFVAAAEGTGSRIVSREATIKHLGTVLTQESFTGIQHSISTSDVFPDELTVNVTDQAGNAAEKTIFLLPEESCDTTPPTRSAEVTAVYGGYEYEIICTDVNCAPSFLESRDTCSEDTTQIMSYASQPFLEQSSVSFCHWVYDAAGNLAEVLEEDFVQQLQCSNGIEDPNERGVDCGGPCLASCSTCENGRQDAFEEGVDCGGVCTTSCRDEDDFFSNLPMQTNTSQQDDISDADDDSSGTLVQECSIDADCNINEYCSISGSCLQRSNFEEGSSASDAGIFSGNSLFGIILLVAGLLFIAGGVYYIYYSQIQKEKLHQAQQQSQQRLSAQQAAQQAAERKKRMEELKKRHAAENETRKTHVNERTQQRKSLLSQFKTEETTSSHQEKTEEDDMIPLFQEKTPGQSLLSNKKKTEKPDAESSSATTSQETDTNEEFLSIEEIHKRHAQIKRSSTFEALSKLSKGASPSSSLDKNLAEDTEQISSSPSSKNSQVSDSSSLSALKNFISSNQHLSLEELKKILEPHTDEKEFVRHAQELLDQKSTDLAGIRSVLDALVKKGNFTKDTIPTLIQQLKIK